MSDKKPIVAIIEETEPPFLTKAFAKVLKKTQIIQEVRFLTRHNEESNLVREVKGVCEAVKIVKMNFDELLSPDDLKKALASVDIVICRLKDRPGNIQHTEHFNVLLVYEDDFLISVCIPSFYLRVRNNLNTGFAKTDAENLKTLLSVMVFSDVKIYFPSEFGPNYNTIKKEKPECDPGDLFDHKMFHFNFALSHQPKLKVIGIFCSMIMEETFKDAYGFNFRKGVWKMAKDVRVAFTSCEDVGRFTVKAALKAYKDPNSVPGEIDFIGETKTLEDCANIICRAANKPLITFQPEEVAKLCKNTNKTYPQRFSLLFKLGALDLTPGEANGHTLLLDQQDWEKEVWPNWVLKTFDKFAKMEDWDKHHAPLVQLE